MVELLPHADTEQMWREVALLRKSTHRRIVPFYGATVKVREVVTDFQRWIDAGALPVIMAS